IAANQPRHMRRLRMARIHAVHDGGSGVPSRIGLGRLESGRLLTASLPSLPREAEEMGPRVPPPSGTRPPIRSRANGEKAAHRPPTRATSRAVATKGEALDRGRARASVNLAAASPAAT